MSDYSAKRNHCTALCMRYATLLPCIACAYVVISHLAGAQALRLNLVKDQVVAVVKQQLEDLGISFSQVYSQVYRVQDEAGGHAKLE